MTDLHIRSDNVDVEQIMRQIRARIREKRGVDYTEEEIKELARVKLEKFLDPGGVRSDLLAQFRKAKTPQPAAPNFAFEDTTIFETHRGIVGWIRKLLKPLLKLFFNPNPIAEALHIQAELNARNAAFQSRRDELDSLHYELIHNLVLETTRLGIQVKNLKMQVESMSSRLDFDERRSRALEGVVQYRPGAVAPQQPQPGAAKEGRDDPQSQERRARRRRRRGRRPASARDESGSSSGAAGPASARDESGSSSGAAGPASARDEPGSSSGAAGTASARDESGSSFDAAGTASRRDEAGRSYGEPGSPRPQSGPQSGEGGPVAPKPLNSSPSGEGG